MNGNAKGTMRAVVWNGKPKSVTVQDVPRPTIQMPEDAIVRVTSASICGSDLHLYHGIIGSTQPPWGMGHEAVGVIDEVGSATEQFKVGDRVLIMCSHDLGHFSIDSGLTPRTPFYGFGPDLGSSGGCQAEYVRVPFADDSLVAIPNEYSSDLDWLMLTDIFPTGWIGLDFAKFEAGDKVVVFGAGPVGLMSVYAARLRGASKVYCVDYVRERLDRAAAMGAVPIDFTSDEGTASEQLLRREPEGVKRVIDCVGQECLNHRLKRQQNYVFQEAIRVVSAGGGIGLVGVYASLPVSEGTPNADQWDADLEIATPQLWRKQVTVAGGDVGEKMYGSMQRLVDMVESGAAKLDFVVSAQLSIEDAPLAYERFDKKLEIKVIFRFPDNRKVGERSVMAEKHEAQNGTQNGSPNGTTAEKGAIDITNGKKLPIHPVRRSFNRLRI